MLEMDDERFPNRGITSYFNSLGLGDTDSRLLAADGKTLTELETDNEERMTDGQIRTAVDELLAVEEPMAG